jgi:chromosome segregation ATPase
MQVHRPKESSMARTSKISYEDVERAVMAVLHAGTNATFQKVYEQLGRKGGVEVVSAHIAEVNRQLAARYVAKDVVEGIDDPRLVVVLRDGILAARKVAEEIVAEGYVAKTQALDDEREQLHAQTQAAKDGLQAAQTLALQIENELSVARAEIAGRDARITDLQASVAAEAAQCTALNERVAVLGQKLDEQAQRHEVAIIEIELRHAASLADLQGELTGERERAAGERRHLLEQTDALRQDKIREVLELQKQMKMAADEAKRTLQERENEIIHLRAQVESSRNDLTGAMAAINTSQATATELRHRNDQLYRELEATKNALTATEQSVAGLQARAESVDDFRRAETARADRAEADLRNQGNPDTKKSKGK